MFLPPISKRGMYLLSLKFCYIWPHGFHLLREKPPLYLRRFGSRRGLSVRLRGQGVEVLASLRPMATTAIHQVATLVALRFQFYGAAAFLEPAPTMAEEGQRSPFVDSRSSSS